MNISHNVLFIKTKSYINEWSKQKASTTNRKQTIYETNLLKQTYEKSKQNKRILNKSVDESHWFIMCYVFFFLSVRHFTIQGP